jgi:hypothetical protein
MGLRFAHRAGLKITMNKAITILIGLGAVGLLIWIAQSEGGGGGSVPSAKQAGSAADVEEATVNNPTSQAVIDPMAEINAPAPTFGVTVN